MARRSKDTPPNRFDTSDFAVGAGLTRRNISLLEEKGLLPTPTNDAERGGLRLWDTASLKRVALIGAFHRAGVELLLAGRLVDAVAEELEARYGEFPSRLEGYLERPLNPTRGKMPWGDVPDEPGEDIRDDYWLHYRLVTLTSIYQRGKAMRFDWFVEVVDREFLFVGTQGLQTLSMDGKAAEGEPLYRIRGWARGADAMTIGLAAEAGYLGDPEARERMARIEAEALAARENAVGILRINASLAIRTALDAVHDHRWGSK